jgi:Tol biopolymer transport system component
MTRRIWPIGICWISLALPVLGQGVPAAPDRAAMARAGRASMKRLETESASWTTTTLVPGGYQFVVEVMVAPGIRRSVLSVEVQGRREEIARITQKDNVWYVNDRGKTGKYRPFEAPLDVPTAYMYLVRSDPLFSIDDSPTGFGTHEGTKDGIATFRSPLPEPMRRQLEKTITEFDQFTKQNPKQVIRPENARSMDLARNLLAHGLSTEIELKSGLLVQFGAPERRTKVTGFHWLTEVDPKQFSTDGIKWDDYTGDPTSGDRNDLLMIAHCALWRPGMPTPDSDGRLLDLKTGRYRRIPFQGAMTLPGCFTRDRTRVVVTGVDTMNGVMGLYEIDLKTGANRRLGGDLLANGFSLFPSLSPDGKTVVVSHKGTTGGILDVQICLVDLASGNASKVGEPLDTGPVSWFPDGKFLLLADRKSIDASKPALSTICRMDLEGRLTKLREGASPVMLGDAKRIFYQDQSSHLWKTCDLEGGDEKPYADGMKGCAFPAPSPDGQRLLMMHFQSGKAPEPMIFPAGGNDGKPATSVSGLWSNPVWR